jgi:hypothetical protein
MPFYEDLADRDEDARIDRIGWAVMNEHKTVAFMTDSDPPDKADRYIRKLTERFPGIRVISRGAGPVADVVYVKMGPPLQ